jgi:hypothetical protein
MFRILTLSFLILVATGCLTGCFGNKSSTATVSATEQTQISAEQTIYAIETTLHLARTSIDASYTAGALDTVAYNKVVPVYNRVLASTKTARRVLKTTIAAGGSPDTSTDYATAMAMLLIDKDALTDLMTALGVAAQKQ